MEAKTLAFLLAVLGAVSVLYNQTKPETALTHFQTWKSKYAMKFDSVIEEAGIQGKNIFTEFRKDQSS